jgi:hypothetical protein
VLGVTCKLQSQALKRMRTDRGCPQKLTRLLVSFKLENVYEGILIPNNDFPVASQFSPKIRVVLDTEVVFFTEIK